MLYRPDVQKDSKQYIVSWVGISQFEVITSAQNFGVQTEENGFQISEDFVLYRAFRPRSCCAMQQLRRWLREWRLIRHRYIFTWEFYIFDDFPGYLLTCNLTIRCIWYPDTNNDVIGCEQELVNPVLVNPNGDRIPCSAINTTPAGEQVASTW